MALGMLKNLFKKSDVNSSPSALSQSSDLSDYTNHYQKARENYARENGENAACIEEINVTIIDPYAPGGNALTLPDNYLQLIDELAAQVASKLDDESNCYFPEKMNRAEDVLLRLKDEELFKLEKLETLAQIILPQLEEKFYGSYIQVNNTNVYRNFVTDNAPVHSWLWHFDNVPKEVHKVMVYLTDVEAETGPFEYLKSPEGKAVIVSPSRTGVNRWEKSPWKKDRVPDEILEGYFKQGYQPFKVTGKKGSIVIFDNNCIHKANVGKEGYRDALAMQIRPALKKMRPYIDRRWSGGFEAYNVPPNPQIVDPYTPPTQS